MSYIKVDYSMNKTTEVVNLEDYGYANSVTWNNLADSERDGIIAELMSNVEVIKATVTQQ